MAKVQNSKSRFFIILTVAIVLGLSARAMFAPKKTQEMKFTVAEKEFIPDFVDKVTCYGHPKPDGERYVSVQKGGRLDALNVKVGDHVEAGAVLGVVDRTLNASNLKSALSNFRLAQKDYSRMAGLSRSGSASREEFDKAQANLEVKRAELERAKQGVEDGILRAPQAGRVTVVIFRTGDKVPDGSRVIAIETPGALRLSCRIPTQLVDRLPTEAAVTWEEAGSGVTPKPVTVKTLVTPAEVGGFVGVDREILLASEAPEVARFDRQRVMVSIPMRAEQNVTKTTSDSIIKRADGYYALAKSAEGYQWIKVSVLRRDADTAYVTGIAPEQDIVRIQSDLNQIESMLARMGDAKKRKG